ncbi:DUF7125 family protein [Halobaculum gomorrense]|uniref:DNA repair protein RadA/Sms n=1 Tax=Halobaculum gomorrense TaxID=43928 RepID=A0A1M5RN75_9EURY|nr:hypothetical protein [Halobaculum gomorrense]SHH27734.1 DNA repair protein RadA/Sms [Halobaculum gomorrense]
MHATGIDPIDRRLGGGVPVGSLTALVAPVGSSAELLLEAAAEPSDALVVSLNRPAPAVADRYSDGTAVVERDPATLAAAPAETFAALPEGRTLVVTPTLGVEQLAPTDLRRVLEAAARAVDEADGAGYLHCPEPATDAAGRIRALARVDSVWLLDVRMGTLTIENWLYVTRVRGGAALDSPLKLKLTDRVAFGRRRYRYGLPKTWDRGTLPRRSDGRY